MVEKSGNPNLNPNPMRSVKLEKLTLNLGCGGDAQVIERAKKLLEMLGGGRKPVVTVSRRRSTFGVAKGKPVGVKLTLRGRQAADFLKQSLAAVDNRINASQFDSEGNFSFGVKEYIELPGVKYKHEIGVLGFDVTVTLRRAGYGIARRRVQARKLPKSQKITREDAIAWAKESCGASIAE
ncbi:MAG: 50S ribosomal protein L5 [Candidatus Aenigmatarchaeota archaeon]